MRLAGCGRYEVTSLAAWDGLGSPHAVREFLMRNQGVIASFHARFTPCTHPLHRRFDIVRAHSQTD